MQSTRALLCLTMTAILAGCGSPPTEPSAALVPLPVQPWQLTNSTTLGIRDGVGIPSFSIWGPSACAQADFRIPGGTTSLEAVLANPPMASLDQPGVGQMGLTLVAPNQTTVQDDPVDGPVRITLLDPPPGRWTARIYPTQAVVNQHANLTITMRGTGDATGELVFWKDPVSPPWDAAGCPGP